MKHGLTACVRYGANDELVHIDSEKLGSAFDQTKTVILGSYVKVTDVKKTSRTQWTNQHHPGQPQLDARQRVRIDG